MTGFFAVLWDKLVRFRNWFVAATGSLLFVVVPLLGAPEIIAIVPMQYHKYLVAAAFVLPALMNLWPKMRPSDPEAIVVKQMKEVAKTEPVTVVVQGAVTGETQIVVEKGQK